LVRAWIWHIRHADRPGMLADLQSVLQCIRSNLGHASWVECGPGTLHECRTGPALSKDNNTLRNATLTMNTSRHYDITCISTFHAALLHCLAHACWTTCCPADYYSATLHYCAPGRAGKATHSGRRHSTSSIPAMPCRSWPRVHKPERRAAKIHCTATAE